MRALARILRCWLPIAWVFLLLGTPSTRPAPYIPADFAGDQQLASTNFITDDSAIVDIDAWLALSAACVIDDHTVDPPDDASQTAPPLSALTANSTLYPPALLATRLSAHAVVSAESSRVLAPLGPRPPPRSL